MAYEVTASRKRPKNFTTLVGQEFVVATLMNALKTRRIAHAYLFSGPRGVGKTSTARILARALNCPDESIMGTEGCFDYPGAEEISRGTAMDVIEIDGASNTSVNDVRAIKDEVLFPPQNSRYKIYIIDEVHMLSNSAFNALLKTIEEPPPYIIFIFATTEIHKVPATIRSRCQQFNFRLIPLEEIIRLLREACADIGVNAEDDALFWIARESTGSMRDAYTLFDQVVAFSEGNITLEKIKEKLGLLGIDEINTLAEHIAAGEQEHALEYLDSMFATGASVEQLVIDLSDYFRGMLFIQQGIKRDGLLGHPRKGFSDKVLETISAAQLEKIIELLLQLYRDIRYSLNSRLELELLVSKLSRISSYLEPQEIVGRISRLREQIAALPEQDVMQLPAEGSASLPHTSTTGKQEAPAQSQAGQSSPAAPGPEVSAREDGYAEDNGDATIPEVPAQAAAVENAQFSSETWKKLLVDMQKSSLSLGAVLSNAKDWRSTGNELHLKFESDMHAATARQDSHQIASAVEALMGRKFTIHIEKVSAESREEEEDPNVEMVKKVFRGELLN